MARQLTYVYAALLDVLGYKDLMEQDRLSGKLELKNSLQQAMKILSTINDVDYNCEAISDTIILTCSKRENLPAFLKVLKKLFIAFLKENLFIRGSVSYSQHFKQSFVTYSPAIVRANAIATRSALYPRIIIDSQIIEMYKATAELKKLIQTQLINTQNETYFLNILTKSNWSTVYEYAKKIYSKTAFRIKNDETIFLKHAWFENYIFSSIHANPRHAKYIPKIQSLT